MLTPIPVLLFSSGSGYRYTYFTIALGGPTTDIIRALPFSREAIEGSGIHVRINYTPCFLISREASEKHPISQEIGLKTPRAFRVFSGKSSRDKRPKIPLSRENGNTHAAPLYIRVGAGTGGGGAFSL